MNETYWTLALAYHFDNLMNNKRPGLVHRIDKDTSGLLVIAGSRCHILKQFEAKTSEREYVRLCNVVAESERLKVIGPSRKRPYANGCSLPE
jgi:23S rRNA-/tRNA-specific pseudouridylate synthase